MVSSISETSLLMSMGIQAYFCVSLIFLSTSFVFRQAFLEQLSFGIKKTKNYKSRLLCLLFQESVCGSAALRDCPVKGNRDRGKGNDTEKQNSPLTQHRVFCKHLLCGYQSRNTDVTWNSNTPKSDRTSHKTSEDGKTCAWFAADTVFLRFIHP